MRMHNCQPTGLRRREKARRSCAKLCVPSGVPGIRILEKDEPVHRIFSCSLRCAAARGSTSAMRNVRCGARWMSVGRATRKRRCASARGCVRQRCWHATSASSRPNARTMAVGANSTRGRASTTSTSGRMTVTTRSITTATTEAGLCARSTRCTIGSRVWVSAARHGRDSWATTPGSGTTRPRCARRYRMRIASAGPCGSVPSGAADPPGTTTSPRERMRARMWPQHSRCPPTARSCPSCGSTPR